MTALASVNLLVISVFSVLGIGAFIDGVSRIVSRILLGRAPAPNRWRPVGKRLLATFTIIFSHNTFLSRPIVRIAHYLVMLSFPLLFLTLIEAYGKAVNPNWHLPVLGRFWPWVLANDLLAWAALLAISVLIGVRLARPKRFQGSKTGQAVFVEAVIWLISASIIFSHASAFALYTFFPEVSSGFEPVLSYPTLLLAKVFSNWSLPALQSTIMFTATIKIVVSMTWLTVVGVKPTMGVAWHRFLAFFSLYTGRDLGNKNGGAKALGALDPLWVSKQRSFDSQLAADPKLLPAGAVLGARVVADLSFKNLLDTLSCTECGRCQEVCPAWRTGKELSPKAMIMGIRDLDAEADIVPGALSEQALWDCTNCGACVQVCPVGVEHLSIVAALRRHQVLSATGPKAWSKSMRNLQSKGNAWGIAASKRKNWAKDLPFTVPVIGRDIPDAREVDYLFWVGSAGSFDPDSQRTTRALAELLHLAGLSFAVLGEAEVPTGDLASRLGDEALASAQNAQAVALLSEVGAKKIVCTSPHVLAVMRTEFPRYGASFEVLHHSALLASLVRAGRLKLRRAPVGAKGPASFTYQDPCFLARHLGEYEDSRFLLSRLGTVLEPVEARERAMCCGAGAGHGFIRETGQASIGALRAKALCDTGAQIIATACPFCHSMLEAGLGGKGQVAVRDIAQLLLESVERD